MSAHLEQLALRLLLKPAALTVVDLLAELNEYLRALVEDGDVLLFLSTPRRFRGPEHDEYALGTRKYVTNRELVTANRFVALEQLQTEFPNHRIYRITFEGFDYPDWFHLLVLANDRLLTDEVFAQYVAPAIKNRVVYALDNIRAAIRSMIVRTSLRSRDLMSFLHRATNEVFKPTFHCEGVSIFYRTDGSAYLTLGSTTGIHEMEKHGLKRTDVKYFLDSKSFTARCYNERKAIVEDSTAGPGLPVNTLGESVSKIINRIYFPIRVRDTTKDQPDGLMGVVRMVNTHGKDGVRPIDCIDIYLLTYLAELVAVLGNRYLRNISILHDQERATHGFGTDLLTIKLATELNMKHIESIGRIINPIASRHSASKGQEQVVLDEPSLQTLMFSLSQLTARSRDIFSIQDHMAEQMVRVLQTKDNYIESSEADGEICLTPYKTTFLRLIGAKEGLAKMFNRRDLAITWNGKDRFDDDLKQLPALWITNSGMYTIVRNLAENAIKYTPQTDVPRIDISWRRKGREVHFQFRDWGIGISKRDEERLFAEGFRGLEAQRMQLRGNGIGLFLSRDIAQRFNGELQYVRPENNEPGSIFTLRVRTHGA